MNIYIVVSIRADETIDNEVNCSFGGILMNSFRGIASKWIFLVANNQELGMKWLGGQGIKNLKWLVYTICIFLRNRSTGFIQACLDVQDWHSVQVFPVCKNLIQCIHKTLLVRTCSLNIPRHCSFISCPMDCRFSPPVQVGSQRRQVASFFFLDWFWHNFIMFFKTPFQPSQRQDYRLYIAGIDYMHCEC